MPRAMGQGNKSPVAGALGKQLDGAMFVARNKKKTKNNCNGPLGEIRDKREPALVALCRRFGTYSILIYAFALRNQIVEILVGPEILEEEVVRTFEFVPVWGAFQRLENLETWSCGLYLIMKYGKNLKL